MKVVPRSLYCPVRSQAAYGALGFALLRDTPEPPLAEAKRATHSIARSPLVGP